FLSHPWCRTLVADAFSASHQNYAPFLDIMSAAVILNGAVRGSQERLKRVRSFAPGAANPF
ncbi:MAG TPA: hypothetical protein VKP30_19560, partial [Polyangiaceae bacterium]|nr:hypothetical protein [Polyangiaceae bacterium]